MIDVTSLNDNELIALKTRLQKELDKRTRDHQDKVVETFCRSYATLVLADVRCFVKLNSGGEHKISSINDFRFVYGQEN